MPPGPGRDARAQFFRPLQEDVAGMSDAPMQLLSQAMRQHGLVRFVEHYAREFADAHLKDLVADFLGPNREMDVNGRRVINFGSDSFLGLDQYARVRAALVHGVEKWGA